MGISNKEQGIMNEERVKIQPDSLHTPRFFAFSASKKVCKRTHCVFLGFLHSIFNGACKHDIEAFLFI